MATEYPKFKFTGIDIASSYLIHIKPHNFEFLQVNILNGLSYANNTFDFVYCRFMIFASTLKNAIKEICRVCKIGDYIEFIENDILFFCAVVIQKTNFCFSV